MILQNLKSLMRRKKVRHDVVHVHLDCYCVNLLSYDLKTCSHSSVNSHIVFVEICHYLCLM